MFVYGCFGYIYVCAPCECLVPMEARRRHKIILELDLQMNVSHQVGLGIKPGTSERKAGDFSTAKLSF